MLKPENHGLICDTAHNFLLACIFSLRHVEFNGFQLVLMIILCFRINVQC